MRKGFFFFFFFGSIQLTFAQMDPLTQVHGASNQALGNIRVHHSNVWSIFNNVGALDRISNSEILGVGFDHRYGLKELTTLNLAGAFRSQKGTFGIGISRFGGKLFNQQTFNLGYSNTLGIASIGIKAEWFQTQIENFGSAGSLLISLGGVAELSPNLFLGAHISNINRGKISRDSESRLPTAVQMGLEYRPLESLNLFFEVEKDIQIQPITKVGIAYTLQEFLVLRSGVNTNPSRLFFGLGVLPGKIQFDYSYGQNSALGSTHHLSLGYKLRD